MAIIACPSCAKPISDKHKQCPHCKINLNSLNVEDREKLASGKKILIKQKLMNQSFVALILFLTGFLVMYTRSPEEGSIELLLTQAMIGIGFIWYLINRIRLVFFKKN